MKNLHILLSLVLLIWCNLLTAQVKISSWNLQNFGKTKSEREINFVADVLRDFDVVALQEIVAGYGGIQAVAKLAEALNGKGSKWEYLVSEPTESTPYATERYAFLWKTSLVNRVERGWLEQTFVDEIDREPFLINLFYNGKPFTLVNFHAISKKKQPETEIKYFKFFPELYSKNPLIFLGDFNVPQSHTVFDPLKKIGYRSVIQNQRTTMKMSCVEGECLASEYDNMFYNSDEFELLNAGVVHFYTNFSDMVTARRISDHVPVWAEIKFL
jgi:deoxyribonuclease-1-like protein